MEVARHGGHPSITALPGNTQSSLLMCTPGSTKLPDPLSTEAALLKN